MISTIWCVFLSFFALFFIGTPIAVLLKSGAHGPDRRAIWLSAPFVGAAAIIVVLQNLVYLNIPISKSSIWLWIGASILWIWLIWRGQIKGLSRSFPVMVMLTAATVYFAHAIGLFVIGAGYYVGRAWHDQFNYTAIAQFLMDYPFRWTLEEITNPYLAKAIHLKEDRIGQSVLHAFLAKSTMMDAKTTFETTILLAPPLISLAIYQLGHKLGMSVRPAILAALVAGLLPAIAMVHLESFMSQALAIPFLLIWPVFFIEALEARCCGSWIVASLILAAATSIYTEFYVIFVGIAVVLTAAHAFSKSNLIWSARLFDYLSDDTFRRLIRRTWGWLKDNFLGYFLTAACVFITALLFNLGFAEGIWQVFHKGVNIAGKGVLGGIYPWAYSIEGLERLWLGDFIMVLDPRGKLILGYVTALLIIVAYVGLIRASLIGRNAISIAVLGMALLPIMVLVHGYGYEYPYYKLLLSISPILALGVVFLAAEVVNKRLQNVLARRLVTGSAALIICVSGLATADMAYRSGTGKTMQEIGRGGAYKLLAPGARGIQDILSTVEGQDVYIIWRDDFYNGGYMNGWLSYFSRKNNTWVANPGISDMSVGNIKRVSDFPWNVERDFLVLTSLRMPGQAGHLMAASDPYYLYKFPASERSPTKVFWPMSDPEKNLRLMLLKKDCLAWVWGDGFYDLEGGRKHNWRWASPRGGLVIINTTAGDAKVSFKMDLGTSHLLYSDLFIKSALVNEHLKINVDPIHYSKTIAIPPGKYLITFESTSKKPDGSKDPRPLSYTIRDFKAAVIGPRFREDTKKDGLLNQEVCSD